jgi:adenylate kinase
VTSAGTRIILIGSPGAGKGTQAERLSHNYGVPHISTGEMFRGAAMAGTAMGKAAKSFMDRGELVPDDVTIGVVEERVAEPDAANGFIMDGFPRTPQQATAFDALVARMGKRLDAAIEIAVPRSVLIARLTGRRMCENCQATYHLLSAPPKTLDVCDRCGGRLIQRDDDTERTVSKRLDVYERQTAPLLSYYSGARLLKTVDGTQSMDDVTAAIVAAVTPKSVRTAS